MMDPSCSSQTSNSQGDHHASKDITIFRQYLGQVLLQHNPWWLKNAPAWCKDIKLPNETLVKQTTEHRADIQERLKAQDPIACPMEIAINETFGRHLVATRNIHPGELLLIEPPLVLTVRPRSPPYCNTCFKRAEEFTCPTCGFFLCGPECLTEEHRAECIFLQRYGFAEAAREKQEDEKLILNRISAMPPDQQEHALSLLQQSQTSSVMQRRLEVVKTYSVVPLIKTIRVMNQSNLLRDITLSLQGNFTRNSQRCRLNQKTIVDAALNKLKIPIEESFAHQICAIWDTNGFEVSLIWGTRVHGLYPFAALMSHDCYANTQQWFTHNGSIALRAVDSIPCGGLITTCYTDPQWATILRQDHLKVTKQFTCTCKRCKDPTEFGTFLGSPICTNCPGLMVSSDPTSPTAEWFCNKGCSCVASTKEIARLGSSVGKDLRGLDPTNMKGVDDLAGHLQTKVHPTHHILFQLHVSNLRNLASKDLSELTEEELVHMSNMAAIVMDVAKRIETPFSRLKITMAREDLRLRIETLKRYKNYNPKVKEQLEALAHQVRDCDLVLGWDERMPSFAPVMEEYQSLLREFS